MAVLRLFSSISYASLALVSIALAASNSALIKAREASASCVNLRSFAVYIFNSFYLRYSARINACVSWEMVISCYFVRSSCKRFIWMSRASSMDHSTVTAGC